MENLIAHEILAGRYKLVEKVGQGTFGEVWHAYDMQEKKGVAAKVYFALDEKSNKDLKREFRNTCKLDHPNLLRPTDFGVSGDRSFIIMPFCSATAATSIGCCGEIKAWEFIRDVANGLVFLHDRGIVHHDIKPDNILIGENGDFVITDFGVSTMARDLVQGEDEMEVGGTEGYMGPEMFMPHAESVAATDIWALGASVYEMLTGELPFHGIGGRALLGDYTPQIEIPYNFVSDNLMQLIRDCMAKETWDRPRAQEIADYTKILFDESIDHLEWKDYFKQARNTIVAEPKPKPTPQPEPEPKPEPARRKLWWIPAAAAAVIGIIVAFWWLSLQHPTNEKRLGFKDPNIPVDTLLTDTIDAPVLNQATYLTVNTEQPNVNVTSKGSKKTVPVATDGATFTIELPENCGWLSLAEKTDTSFVLIISPNETTKKRSDTIKVISGDLVKKVAISQGLNKNANLKPANGLNSSNEILKSIDILKDKETSNLKTPTPSLTPATPATIEE